MAPFLGIKMLAAPYTFLQEVPKGGGGGAMTQIAALNFFFWGGGGKRFNFFLAWGPFFGKTSLLSITDHGSGKGRSNLNKIQTPSKIINKLRVLALALKTRRKWP